MKIHIVMHESFESPAAIENWAAQKKHQVSYSRVYKDDALPNHISDFDFLIVMGGPQSPATTTLECPYFDAKAEIALIKQSIEAKKLVLGICLGAQLIGEAFGAKFEHSPYKEIGVFKINLTPDAQKDPIFSKFPQSFFVGHWHSDMPGLSENTVVLAYSEGCPRQIIKYAPNVYGFQCHLEFTSESIEEMISSCGNELYNAKNLPYVQTAEELRQQDYQNMNKLLFEFLDQFELSHTPMQF